MNHAQVYDWMRTDAWDTPDHGKPCSLARDSMATSYEDSASELQSSTSSPVVTLEELEQQQHSALQFQIVDEAFIYESDLLRGYVAHSSAYNTSSTTHHDPARPPPSQVTAGINLQQRCTDRMPNEASELPQLSTPAPCSLQAHPCSPSAACFDLAAPVPGMPALLTTTTDAMLPQLSFPFLLDEEDPLAPLRSCLSASHGAPPHLHPPPSTIHSQNSCSSPILSLPSLPSVPSLPPQPGSLQTPTCHPSTSTSWPLEAKRPALQPPINLTRHKRAKLASIAKQAASRAQRQPVLLPLPPAKAKPSHAPCPVVTPRFRQAKPSTAAAAKPSTAAVAKPPTLTVLHQGANAAALPAAGRRKGAPPALGEQRGAPSGGSAGAPGCKARPSKAGRKQHKGSSRKGHPRKSLDVTCLNCGTQQTPQWRRGPDGPRSLCNACGVRYTKGLPLPYLCKRAAAGPQ